MKITLRPAEESDLPAVLALIHELAVYEKAADEVTITLEELSRDGFGERPLFEIVLAESNGVVVGMSFYYIRYSTWKGRCIYLEDLVVKGEWRGRGVGKLLFEETMRIARDSGASAMNWQVLDWNEPAIHFYRKFNAKLDPEWINGSLSARQLQQFE
jgi:GNAT superfamily N-acetyltransferase